MGGLNYQYGVQYVVNPESKNKITIGYSGTLGSKLKTSGSITTYRYTYNSVLKTESAPIDTIYFNPTAESKIKLPMSHTLGIAIERTNNWVVGADLSYTQWSKFSDSESGSDLQDSYGVAIGGQYTPDAS